MAALVDEKRSHSRHGGLRRLGVLVFTLLVMDSPALARAECALHDTSTSARLEHARCVGREGRVLEAMKELSLVWHHALAVKDSETIVAAGKVNQELLHRVAHVGFDNLPCGVAQARVTFDGVPVHFGTQPEGGYATNPGVHRLEVQGERSGKDWSWAERYALADGAHMLVHFDGPPPREATETSRPASKSRPRSPESASTAGPPRRQRGSRGSPTSTTHEETLVPFTASAPTATPTDCTLHDASTSARLDHARCLARDGGVLEAMEELEDVGREAFAAGDSQNVVAAMKVNQELLPRVVHVRLGNLPCDVAQARITLDGAPVAFATQPDGGYATNPGVHRLQVQGERGGQDWSWAETYSLRDGAHMLVAFDGPPPAEATETSRPSSRSEAQFSPASTSTWTAGPARAPKGCGGCTTTTRREERPLGARAFVVLLALGLLRRRSARHPSLPQ